MRKIIPVMTACVIFAAGLCAQTNLTPTRMNVYDAEEQVFKRYWNRSFYADKPSLLGFGLAFINTEEYISFYAMFGAPFSYLLGENPFKGLPFELGTAWGVNYLEHKVERGFFSRDERTLAGRLVWAFGIDKIFGIPIILEAGPEFTFIRNSVGLASLTNAEFAAYRYLPQNDLRLGFFFMYNVDLGLITSHLYATFAEFAVPRDLTADLMARLGPLVTGPFMKIKNMIEIANSAHQFGFSFKLDPFKSMFVLEGRIENSYTFKVDTFNFDLFTASLAKSENYTYRVFLTVQSVKAGLWYTHAFGVGGMLAYRIFMGDKEMPLPMDIALKYNEIDEDPVFGRNVGFAFELTYFMH